MNQAQHTPRKIALFDLDRTLADYDGAMQRDLAKYSPQPMPMAGTRWPDELFAIATKIKQQQGWWESIPTISTGLEIFDYCTQLGFQNIIFSKASEVADNSWTEKYIWCKKNLFPRAPGTKVHITDDNKSLSYGNILVDDWVPYMTGWLTKRPRGLGIMPQYDSNANFTHPQVIFYENAKPLSDSLKQEIQRIKDRR